MARGAAIQCSHERGAGTWRAPITQPPLGAREGTGSRWRGRALLGADRRRGAGLGLDCYQGVGKDNLANTTRLNNKRFVATFASLRIDVAGNHKTATVRQVVSLCHCCLNQLFFTVRVRRKAAGIDAVAVAAGHLRCRRAERGKLEERDDPAQQHGGSFKDQFQHVICLGRYDVDSRQRLLTLRDQQVSRQESAPWIRHRSTAP